MSKKKVEAIIRESLEEYFRNLRGTEPHGMYDMVIQAAERPLLEAVMQRTQGNQSLAAQWLGINRNTLRSKLLAHKLIK
jgi:Fis family transcriptional regulator